MVVTALFAAGNWQRPDCARKPKLLNNNTLLLPSVAIPRRDANRNYSTTYPRLYSGLKFFLRYSCHHSSNLM